MILSTLKFTFILLCVAITGCNQTLTISVQRLDTGSSASTIYLAYLKQKAYPALIRATNVIKRYPLELKQLDGVQQGEKPKKLLQSFEANLPAEPKCPKEASKSLVDRISEYLNLDAENQTEAETIQLISLARQYVSQTNAAISKIASLARASSAENEEMAKLIELFITPILEESEIAAKSVNIGYGGYVSNEIYEISASDPEVRHLLKRCNSGNCPSFTRTFANVSGDSTMIFVAESPVQNRFYSVEMDSDTLTRNIIFITDKALQAAVKYAAPVP